MNADSLFLVALVAQIVVISIFYPVRLARQVKTIVADRPPAEYPRLYRQSGDFYARAIRNHQVRDWAVVAAGGVLFAGVVLFPGSGEWHRPLACAYFFLQIYPLILFEIFLTRHFKMIRREATEVVRTAELRARRLTDVVSARLLLVAGLTYVCFAFFIAYIDKFDFPWFGGYWNLVGVTAMNVFLAWLVYQKLSGQKPDPYQSHDDFLQALELTARTCTYVSIAATLFITLAIVLASTGLRPFEAAATCLYLVLIMVIAQRTYRLDGINFEAYRESAALD